MHSYKDIDSLILNKWREASDSSFIDQFTEAEIEEIAQYITNHNKADFRARDYTDNNDRKENIVIDYIRHWAIDLLLLDRRDDFQELASILEWF